MNLKRRSNWNVQESVWVWAGPLAAVLVLMLIVSPLVRARPAAAAASAAAAGTSDKLVFLVTTGLEDSNALDTVLQYAISARASGHISEVVILADGRGVEILAAHMGARPAQTAQLAKKAKAAGIRFVVTDTGLKQVDMTKTDLDPAPDEIIPDGGARLAGLISQHFETIHF